MDAIVCKDKCAGNSFQRQESLHLNSSQSPWVSGWRLRYWRDDVWLPLPAVPLTGFGGGCSWPQIQDEVGESAWQCLCLLHTESCTEEIVRTPEALPEEEVVKRRIFFALLIRGVRTAFCFTPSVSSSDTGYVNFIFFKYYSAESINQEDSVCVQDIPTGAKTPSPLQLIWSCWFLNEKLAPPPADISEWRQPRATAPRREKDPDNQVTSETLPLEKETSYQLCFMPLLNFCKRLESDWVFPLGWRKAVI